MSWIPCPFQVAELTIACALSLPRSCNPVAYEEQPTDSPAISQGVNQIEAKQTLMPSICRLLLLLLRLATISTEPSERSQAHLFTSIG